MHSFDLDSLRIATEDITKSVAQFISEQSRQFSQSSIQYKGTNDLVSYVDKEAERRLVDSLSTLVPEAAFITEEQTVDYKEADWVWIIDPLDGTTNFIHGLPIYSISVALMYKGTLKVGVVHEVCQNECFSAAEGKGAFLNGQKITCSSNDQLSKSLVATGFPYTRFEKLPAYLQILDELMQCSHGIRRLGSAAVDLVYAACGRFEVFFEYNLNAWDVAAGILIVQEAGGVCVEFNGGSDVVFGRSVIAGNAKVVEELKGIIAKHFND